LEHIIEGGANKNCRISYPEDSLQESVPFVFPKANDAGTFGLTPDLEKIKEDQLWLEGMYRVYEKNYFDSGSTDKAALSNMNYYKKSSEYLKNYIDAVRTGGSYTEDSGEVTESNEETTKEEPSSNVDERIANMINNVKKIYKGKEENLTEEEVTKILEKGLEQGKKIRWIEQNVNLDAEYRHVLGLEHLVDDGVNILNPKDEKVEALYKNFFPTEFTDGTIESSISHFENIKSMNEKYAEECREKLKKLEGELCTEKTEGDQLYEKWKKQLDFHEKMVSFSTDHLSRLYNELHEEEEARKKEVVKEVIEKE